VPVTAPMIIRPVTNADREIQRIGLGHQSRRPRDNRCEKNQNFSFHI
jgi:hypothetical protein